jgi:hypothetical protein
MTLKAIDIQMAIHRSDEAGVRQNQLLQKPEDDQSQLGQQLQKQAEREQQQPVKPGPAAEAHIRGSGEEGGGAKRQGGGQKQAEAKPHDAEAVTPAKPAPHPYKGHFIDLSL